MQVSCGLLTLSTRTGIVCISHKGSSLQMGLPAHQDRSRQLQTLQRPSSRQVCGETPGSFLQYLACITSQADIAATPSCTVQLTPVCGLHLGGHIHNIFAPVCAVHCMLAFRLGSASRSHRDIWLAVRLNDCRALYVYILWWNASGAEVHAPMVEASVLGCCSPRAAAQQHRQRAGWRARPGQAGSRGRR